jgi:single-strand DNA-binding protein
MLSPEVIMVMLNRVLLIGHLTADPELRMLPSGTAVCEFTVALNRAYTSKQTNEKVEEVSFVDVVAWGRTGEVCAQYLKKGRATYVEGRLTQSRWESPEGKKMSRLRVTAESVQFMGGKPGEPRPGSSPEPAEEPAENELN